MSAREDEITARAEAWMELRHYAQTQTQWMEMLAGRMVNHVLESWTGTIDSNGYLTRSYHVAAGSLKVINLAATDRQLVPTSNHPANPAVGAEFSITVPAGQTWQLQSVTLTLATSAQVATRIPTLIIDDGTNVIWQLQSAVSQAASLTQTYDYAGAVEIALRNGIVTEPLPVITLGPGWRVRTLTAALQTGDQYSAIDLAYQQANSAGSHAMTVAASAPVSAGLPYGTGAWTVPANTEDTIPLASRAFTIYGTPGDAVGFQVYTSPIQPGTH